MKICFLAPSSYGKSTAVKIIQKHFNSENVKIAEPLYDLQNKFYKYIYRNIGDQQDGELLQYLGIKIRKENPSFLIEEFKKVVNETFKEIITNDDCRTPDYEYLKEMGFIFININGYERERGDYTNADKKNNLEWTDTIPCDYVLDNYGTMEEYEKNILKLIKEIKENEKMLHDIKRKLLK